MKTSEDFGTRGDRPSHPELLDWLAVEFVKDGWDVKAMMKRLVMSATYRQSSHVAPEKLQRDPSNRLLARGPRFRLDAEMLDRVAATDTVFVYAKAVSGPPMPLAVARHQVADLPLKVVLNDSMAMMPQMKLSSFDRVLVGARISKTGQAMPQSGDLQSDEIETASDSTGRVQLLINQQRP